MNFVNKYDLIIENLQQIIIYLIYIFVNIIFVNIIFVKTQQIC
jgi:hypothetical protein